MSMLRGYGQNTGSKYETTLKLMRVILDKAKSLPKQHENIEFIFYQALLNKNGGLEDG